MKVDNKQIAKLLTEKGAVGACHRCGQGGFTVLEGITNLMIQDTLTSGIRIGGPTVPVAHVVCNNCGAITSHAIGALGLLPDEKEDNANG